MLPKYLKQKKRHFAVLILILVYLLLLCQEVVLHRVICIQPKGAVELEYTFLNYRCPCQDNELSSSKKQDLYSLNADMSCSLHIPLEDSYLVRLLPPDQNIFENIFYTEIYIKTKSDFDSHVCQIHHLLPYIRYLKITPDLDQYFVLLC